MVPNYRLFEQSEVRLALTAGLSAGLTITLGLPDPMYAPMAVAAVLSGTLGNSLSLGMQRIQGTILGGVILFIAHNTIANSMPMPIGIGISLACTRIFGGSLGLRSGYKVAGLVVVMGWTVHANSINSWLPMRLFVTLIGVLLSLIAINAFWPSRALAEHQKLSQALFNGFAEALQERVKHLKIGVDMQAEIKRQRRDGLLSKLMALQNQRPAALVELGADRNGERLLRLWDLEEQFFTELIGYYRTLLRLPMLPMDGPELQNLLEVELDVLSFIANQLICYANIWPNPLTKQDSHQWSAALEAAEQQIYENPKVMDALLASSGGRRAMVCNQLLQAIERFQNNWIALA